MAKNTHTRAYSKFIGTLQASARCIECSWEYLTVRGACGESGNIHDVVRTHVKETGHSVDVEILEHRRVEPKYVTTK